RRYPWQKREGARPRSIPNSTRGPSGPEPETGEPALVSRRTFPLWGRAQDFQRADGSGIAAFDAEFFKDAAHMLFDGLFSHAEEDSDVAVAFTLGNPEQDFGFARRQLQRFQGLGGFEVGLEPSLRAGGGDLGIVHATAGEAD